MAKQYYYFIAGLPTVSIDDSKVAISPESFREQAREQLSEKDFRLLGHMRILSDLDNLLNLLYNKQKEPDPEGLYDLDYWKEYLSFLRHKLDTQSLKTPDEFAQLPDFVAEIISPILAAEDPPDFADAEHRLLTAFFDYSKDHPNKFFREFFELERNIKNILAAINGREHNVEYARYLIGHDDTTVNLAKSHAADFGLGKEHPLFDNIMRIWEQNDILYRERGYDVLRNKWIDEQNFFEYFNIDRILGYYSKIRIIHRWQKADAELGKEVFHDTLNKLESSFSFPEEFNIRIKHR